MSNRLYAEKQDDTEESFAMDMAKLTEGLTEEYEDYESVGTTEFEGTAYSSDEVESRPSQVEEKKPEAAKAKAGGTTEKTSSKPRPPAKTVDESMSVKKTEALVKQMMKETKDERKESLGIEKAKAAKDKSKELPGKPKKSMTTTKSEESSPKKSNGRSPGSLGPKTPAQESDGPRMSKTKARKVKRRKSKEGHKVEKKSTFDTLRDDGSDTSGRTHGSGFAKSRFTRRRGKRTKKKDPKAVAEQVQKIFSENQDEEFEFRNPEVKDTDDLETSNYHEMLNYGLQSDVLKATGGVKAVIEKQKDISFPTAEGDSDEESKS